MKWQEGQVVWGKGNRTAIEKTDAIVSTLPKKLSWECQALHKPFFTSNCQPYSWFLVCLVNCEFVLVSSVFVWLCVSVSVYLCVCLCVFMCLSVFMCLCVSNCLCVCLCVLVCISWSCRAWKARFPQGPLMSAEQLDAQHKCGERGEMGGSQRWIRRNIQEKT